MNNPFKFDHFLSRVPARNYIFQSESYQELIEKAACFIQEADYVLIGAGAGMSTAAGAQYGGKWFEENFSEFQKKYGSGPYMRDMYSAGFYPYPSEEAYWGYWSKQCLKAGIEADLTPLHKVLLSMLKNKKIFCLSTNADGQFVKAGLDKNRIFTTQGDYFHIQCAYGCHQKTYDSTELFKEMDKQRKDCLIPSYLVPKCPVCNGRMDMNLRIDSFFVEDEQWHNSEQRFGNFLMEAINSKNKICLLELGVGFNTPTIIRFPFEHLLRKYPQISLVRLNLDEAVIPEESINQAVGINEDIKKSLADLSECLSKN